KMKKVARAMFEICLNKKRFRITMNCLQIAKIIENGSWKIRDDIAEELPQIKFDTFLQPISKSVIQVNFFITPDF
ncbi:hypothetical protein L9F63_001241, partial [Diploptera punctata]